MIVEDAVLIARTVPEDSKKYGTRICSVWFSEERRELFRVYPLPVSIGMKAWGVARLNLMRNSTDSRKESWRLVREEGDAIQPVCAADKSETMRLMRKYCCDSVRSANAARLSLAVVKACDARVYFDRNGSGRVADDQYQLFGEQEKQFATASDYAFTPRIEFTHEGERFDYQLREWGCYEYLRRHGIPKGEWPQWLSVECELLIGNLCAFRNRWLVIHGFKAPSPQKQLTFSGCN